MSAAQALLQELPEQSFQPSSMRGYRFVELCSVYGGIPQRWLVVESKTRKEADLKQLQKHIDKALSQ